MKIKVLLLAAGQGERLLPITKNIPKPLVEIGGQSNLERNLKHLAKYRIENIIINLYYLPHKITRFVKNGKNFGVKVSYFREKKLLGTAGTIKSLERKIGGATFLVIYGDNFAKVNLYKLVKYHKKYEGILTITVFKDYFDPHSSGIVELSCDNSVVKYTEKPKRVFSIWADAGIYVCEPDIMQFLPKNKKFSITKNLIPLLLKERKKVLGYKIRGPVLSLDTPQKLKRAQELVRIYPKYFRL